MERTPSEWCYEKRDECLKQSKYKDADIYLNMAVMWREREERKNG